ncbi:endopeptidase La [Polyangium jinanense]|uniref:Lon protease n=1 Tax=Polyangium jinanense TaxID=2829994 RepID=A0A9X3XB89_9BACT|nr:endopeptidase La [Polyangium jinanense]MDC3960883.1 endopeptidase La [Polyangium jinanense]MDC3984706.1 endopeptidase La [Polyangium jinanense]
MASNGAPPSRPPSSSGEDSVPILPLRNSVLFPMSVVPINVGRPRSVRLVEDLLGRERALVGVISQRSPEIDEPTFKELYTVGTIARVVKVIRLGPSNYSVVLNGLGRFRVKNIVALEPYMRAKIERIPESLVRDVELDALGTGLREATREVLQLMPNLPRDTAGILDNVREPGALADLIASNFPQAQASVADKQEILEAFDVKARVRLVLAMVGRQLEVLRVKKEISSMVQEEMGKSQREYILRQQMKSIREELGEAGEDDEIEELRERVRRAKVPTEVEKVVKKQLGRMRSMAQQSAEYNVTRTYVEWIADLPWSKTTVDRISVQEVRRCLDEDHMGLEKVKKRIVEYAAIRQLRADKKGPILLFIGPPGVGKTSLGRSIARAMGRQYERIALGGVRDEAEIRGHRRTYVGALPGRILQALKKAGTKNPVLVLDEVDKMGVDLRGDPAAALLEVLDPEQNSTFQDHYLDMPFDLSQVMFLATANNRDTIPPALFDRMEVIEVPGYTRTDKLGIAREFLVPKQLSAHGLTDERLEFTEPGIATLIDHYTREAGVRGLEREIAAVCRATAVKLAEGNAVLEVVSPEHVEKVLGPHKHRPEIAERNLDPGVATGLAWTPTGGEILFIEATKMPGKGNVVLTGNMKNVMQESATTAVSFVRSKAGELHLDPEWLKNIDLHVHIPKHGTPKDGPSAGVTMFTAVCSLLLGCPVRSDVAMTGEISLRGRIMSVGGVKEKLLAAHRAGIKHVIIPAKNRKDLEDVPQDILDEVKVTLVNAMDEILPLVLEPPRQTTVSTPPPPQA